MLYKRGDYRSVHDDAIVKGIIRRRSKNVDEEIKVICEVSRIQKDTHLILLMTAVAAAATASFSGSRIYLRVIFRVSSTKCALRIIQNLFRRERDDARYSAAVRTGLKFAQMMLSSINEEKNDENPKN